jgi:hypothetical protein
MLIPVKIDKGGQGRDSVLDSSVPQRICWLPNFVLKLRTARDCLIPHQFLTAGNVWLNRVMRQRFELKRSSVVLFPHNFFPRLFLSILNSCDDCQDVCIFEDGLSFECAALASDLSQTRMMVTVVVGAGESFTITVATNTNSPCVQSPSFAWITMDRISCMVKAANSVWAEDHLDHYCVDPRGDSECLVKDLKISEVWKTDSVATRRCCFGTTGSYDEVEFECKAEILAVANFLNPLILLTSERGLVLPPSIVEVTKSFIRCGILGEI